MQLSKLTQPLVLATFTFLLFLVFSPDTQAQFRVKAPATELWYHPRGSTDWILYGTWWKGNAASLPAAQRMLKRAGHSTFAVHTNYTKGSSRMYLYVTIGYGRGGGLTKMGTYRLGYETLTGRLTWGGHGTQIPWSRVRALQSQGYTVSLIAGQNQVRYISTPGKLAVFSGTGF